MAEQTLNPRMTTGEKASLIVRIDAMVAFGVPIAKACREVGLPRVAYYRAKEKGRSPAKEAAPMSNNPERSPTRKDDSDGPSAAGSGETSKEDS